MVDYEIADSLLALRSQLDVAYPKRSRKSDGMIGDASHQSRDSDHNPWWVHKGQAYVTAADFTDDASAMSCFWLANQLRLSRDHRIKYVIWNKQIMSGAKGPDPWKLRPYSGSNPHTKHLHLSVLPEPQSLTSSRWSLGPGLVPSTAKEVDVTPAELWGFKIHDLYTPNPADTMTVGVALEWALRHAADARDTARRCEEKLDALARKLDAR